MTDEISDGYDTIKITTQTNTQKGGGKDGNEDMEETEEHELRLGDIIQFTAPKNDILNRPNTFYIEYIDNNSIDLVNTNSFARTQQPIHPDSTIGDGSIEQITILSRNPKSGYARQNGLLPDKWVNIYFSGEVPFILVGHITNLEQDMIELRTVDDDIMYINFAYHGIPRDLPITLIDLRDPPAGFMEAKLKQARGERGENGEYDDESDAGIDVDYDLDMDLNLDLADGAEREVDTAKEIQKVQQVLFEVRDVKFGEMLGTVHELVEVNKEQMRYNVDSQTNDMMEDLIAAVPIQKRSDSVMNAIHTIISRFIQLRTLYSHFDENGNVIGAVYKSAEDRPLADYLRTFHNRLHWILFVTKMTRKIYLDEERFESAVLDMGGLGGGGVGGWRGGNSTADAQLGGRMLANEITAAADVLYEKLISEQEDTADIARLLDEYKSNAGKAEGTNKYERFHSQLASHFVPMLPPPVQDAADILIEAEVPHTSTTRTDENRILAVMNNFGDFYSQSFERKPRRFQFQQYTGGITKLNTVGLKSSTYNVERVPMTAADKLYIQSVVTLPEAAVVFSNVNLPGSNILMKSNLSQHFISYWQFLRQSTRYTPIGIENFNDMLDYSENNFVDNIKHYSVVPNSVAATDTSISRDERFYRFLRSIIPKIRVLFRLVNKYIHGRLSIPDIMSYMEPFMIYADDLTYRQYVEITAFIAEKIREYNRKYVEYHRAFSLLKHMKSTIYPVTLITQTLPANTEYYTTIVDEYHLSRFTEQATPANTATATNREKERERMEERNVAFTNTELLRDMILADYGRLFNTANSLEHIQFMYAEELDEIFDASAAEIKDKMNASAKKGNKGTADSAECETKILAKKYYSKQVLESDNGRVIYFDKDYDTTDYDKMEKYTAEKARLATDALLQHIANDLVTKEKMTQDEADYMAETLVHGTKRVRDGNIAILSNEDEVGITGEGSGTKRLLYYRRENDEWTVDTTIDPASFIVDKDLLCNIQPKCLYDTKQGECKPLSAADGTVASATVGAILGQFDKAYKYSKEKMEKFLKKQYERYRDHFGRLRRYKYYQQIRNAYVQYELGLRLGMDTGVNGNDDGESEGKGTAAADKEVSPYLGLAGLIMSQSNFVKMQTDILRFISLYARPGDPTLINIHDGDNENPWFYYCKTTGTRLIPTFKFILARSFVTNPATYDATLQMLIKEIGVLSDSGGEWIDRNSGMKICDLQLDEEEGYEDGGFRTVTRAELEEDVNDILVDVLAKEKMVADLKMGAGVGVDAADGTMATASSKKLTELGRTIMNVVDTLTMNAGIRIDSQLDFIVKGVTDMMSDPTILEREETYRQRQENAAKLGKKLPDYSRVYNSTLMYLILGVYIIAVQTCVPSVRTKKTFPGCVRSFSGFPLESNGDDSALTYLACITVESKSKNAPWNVLSAKTTKEEIAGRIRQFLTAFILKRPEMERAIQDKVEYLLSGAGGDVEIPEEYQLSRWVQYVPPLVRFHVGKLQGISGAYETQLLQDIRSGHKDQSRELDVIQSKIYAFSLAMQEGVQEIVSKKHLLLRSSVKPFMMNACCSEKKDGDAKTGAAKANTETVLEYFGAEDKAILDANNRVGLLSSVLKDVKQLTKATMLLSSVNTKRVFPVVSGGIFNEELIYKSFIHYCHFLTFVVIPPELSPICVSKPDYLRKNETIHEQIGKMKQNGVNYKMSDFLKLFQLISRKGIVTNLNVGKMSKPKSVTSRLKLFLAMKSIRGVGGVGNGISTEVEDEDITEAEIEQEEKAAGKDRSNGKIQESTMGRAATIATLKERKRRERSLAGVVDGDSGMDNGIDVANGEGTVSGDATVLKLLRKVGELTEDKKADEMIYETPNQVDDIRQLNNYLAKEIGVTREILYQFVAGGTSKVQRAEKARLKSFIDSLGEWRSDRMSFATANSDSNDMATMAEGMPKLGFGISDDALYKYMQFMRNTIISLNEVYPAMILNQQPHNFEGVKYWNLAQRHTADLRDFVTKYYKDVSAFYGNKTIQRVLYEVQQDSEWAVLARITPAFSTLRKKNGNVRHGSFNKRTVMLLYEYYLLKLMSRYMALADSPKMIYYSESEVEMEVSNINQLQFYGTTEVIRGNQMQLRESVSELLLAYLRVIMRERDAVDISYNVVMDRVFKLKEAEKDTFTDRLKQMTDDERKVNMFMKMHKLGEWGEVKGLVEYEAETYEKERDMMRGIAENIARIGRQNGMADDEIDDAVRDAQAQEAIDAEAYGMGGMGENYYDGDPYGEERDPDDYEY